MLLPQAWRALRGLPSVCEWVSRWAKGRQQAWSPLARQPETAMPRATRRVKATRRATHQERAIDLAQDRCWQGRLLK